MVLRSSGWARRYSHERRSVPGPALNFDFKFFARFRRDSLVGQDFLESVDNGQAFLFYSQPSMPMVAHHYNFETGSWSTLD